MKFLTTFSILLAGLYLNGQSFSSRSPVADPPIAIQTFDVSCSGKSNGSLYARAEEPGWQLKMYKSYALIAEYSSQVQTRLSLIFLKEIILLSA